jgi:hypothetical protein
MSPLSKEANGLCCSRSLICGVQGTRRRVLPVVRGIRFSCPCAWGLRSGPSGKGGWMGPPYGTPSSGSRFTPMAAPGEAPTLPATFSTNHSASSSTGARPLYSDWDAVVASVYSFLLDCAVFCVVIPVETPPMMHVPSTSKRSTCFTALSYFLMRPQLLTR